MDMWSHGLMVKTQDSEPWDASSILAGTLVALLAQLGERAAVNREAIGSIPIQSGADSRGRSSMVEYVVWIDVTQDRNLAAPVARVEAIATLFIPCGLSVRTPGCLPGKGSSTLPSGVLLSMIALATMASVCRAASKAVHHLFGEWVRLPPSPWGPFTTSTFVLLAEDELQVLFLAGALVGKLWISGTVKIIGQVVLDKLRIQTSWRGPFAKPGVYGFESRCQL